MKPGVPNLCLSVPSERYHSLFVEMKTDVGWTSAVQKMQRIILFFNMIRHGFCSRGVVNFKRNKGNVF